MSASAAPERQRTVIEGTLVRPFAGLRPVPERAAEVAAPPYDVVDVHEARRIVNERPLSFLRVSRAEAGLPEGVDPYSREVYEAAARNLKDLEAFGTLVRDEGPAYYVYRMTANGQAQTGVAVSASIDAYVESRIRKHELTMPEKEDDRKRQIEAVDAITGPVLMTHRANRSLASLLADAAADREADIVVPDLDGVRHEVWTVRDADRVAAVSRAMNAMDALYIGDGHHRSAAAARVSAARRATGRSGGGFLAVCFPEDEVSILGYNRVVRDLGGLAPAELVGALARDFDVRAMDGPVCPNAPRSFGLYLAGQWHSLTLRKPDATKNPVMNLDVSLLDRLVLKSHLGIGSPATDPRISFVGGSHGVEGVAALVDSGEMAAGFTLFPCSVAELMAVADAEKIMPPKSTWFHPKLADGLISLPLD